MRKRFRFHKFMLNGCSGDVTRAVKRLIVRGHNHELVVTSTRRGPRFPGDRSYHIEGRAVDFGNKRRGNVGADPGTPRARRLMVKFQRFLLRRFGAGAFLELYGPDNNLNVKNGQRIRLDEGTALEQQHDTHVHVVPARVLPLPKLSRAMRERLRRERQIRRARKAGARYVRAIFKSADKHNVSRALALALFQQESNFINQYGHDRDRHGRIIWHGKSGLVRVTRANYRDYLAFRRRTGLCQGVGPGQLTSASYQDLADRRGGCWKASVNIDVSLDILRGHIKALGTFRGVGAYNGGRGNPQFDYAKSVLAKREQWRKVLAG